MVTGVALAAVEGSGSAGAVAVTTRAASTVACNGYFLALPGDGSIKGVRHAYALATAGAGPKATFKWIQYPNRRLTAGMLRQIPRKKLKAAYFKGWQKGTRKARKALVARTKVCKTEPITIAGFAQGAVAARALVKSLKQHAGILDRVVVLGLERDPLAHHARGVRFEHWTSWNASSKGHGLARPGKPRLGLPGAIARKPVTIEDCLKGDRLCSGKGHLTARQVRTTLSRTKRYQATTGGWAGIVFNNASEQAMQFHTGTNPRYAMVGGATSINLGAYTTAHAKGWTSSTLPPGLSLKPATKDLPAHIDGRPTQAGTWPVRLVQRAPALSRTAYTVTNLTIHVEPTAVGVPGLTLVTEAAGGGPADGMSDDPVVSADGSTVAYTSTATNLIPGIDLSNIDAAQLYVRTASGSTILLSNAAGGPGDYPHNEIVDISADGSEVLYWFGKAWSGSDRHLYLADLSDLSHPIHPIQVPGDYLSPLSRGAYVLHHSFDKAKKQIVLQLWNKATDKAVGKACRGGNQGIALDDDNRQVPVSVGGDGSVFGVVLAHYGQADYSQTRDAVVCHTTTGRLSHYGQQQRADVSADGTHLLLSAGTGEDGVPDADNVDSQQLHAVRQIDLTTGASRVPYAMPPLTWAQDQDEMNEQIIWHGMGISQSADGSAVAFASDDYNLEDTGLAQPSEIHLWRPQTSPELPDHLDLHLHVLLPGLDRHGREALQRSGVIHRRA